MLERTSSMLSGMKNANAVALGRLGGLRGGPARSLALSSGRRVEIARRAAESRWSQARRISRRREAERIAGKLSVDVGVAEHTLLLLDLTFTQRLAQGLGLGRAKLGRVT